MKFELYDDIVFLFCQSEPNTPTKRFVANVIDPRSRRQLQLRTWKQVVSRDARRDCLHDLEMNCRSLFQREVVDG